MRRTFMPIAAAVMAQIALAMPIGVRLAGWSVFTPDMVTVEVTGGDQVAVPAGWISSWPEILTAAGDDRERALKSTAANGRRTVSECYALGLDPTDATNDFRIVSIEMVDGVPHVEWEPKVNRWTGAEINATLKGAASLDEKNWATVTEQNWPSFRFFKVEVELP